MSSPRRPESARTRRTVGVTLIVIVVVGALLGYFLGSSGLEPTSWQAFVIIAVIAVVASSGGLFFYVRSKR